MILPHPHPNPTPPSRLCFDWWTVFEVTLKLSCAGACWDAIGIETSLESIVLRDVVSTSYVADVGLNQLIYYLLFI